jgi:mono/diheme cytochrome c family protein
VSKTSVSPGRSLLTLAVIAAAGVALWWFLPNKSTVVSVTVPELSPAASAGQEAFAAHCAGCHGPNAGGTNQGPPLIHQWYRPDHHADVAFTLAAQRGVSQHHWNFGNMPPQPQVGDRSMQQIITFVRELQRANQIY